MKYWFSLFWIKSPPFDLFSEAGVNQLLLPRPSVVRYLEAAFGTRMDTPAFPPSCVSSNTRSQPPPLGVTTTVRLPSLRRKPGASSPRAAERQRGYPASDPVRRLLHRN